jgi:OOP family OmpA-OmpF porin
MRYILSFVLLLVPLFVSAQDIGGSKDYPLLSRYPDSRITDYSKNYNALSMSVGIAEDGNPALRLVEGDTTSIRYFYKDLEHQPSPLQLIRNYQNVVKGLGGEVVYERLPRDGDGGETTLKLVTAGKEIWMRVVPEIFSAPTQSYKLDVVEVAAMQQVITANKLLEELNSKGFVTIYINFDSGKWDIKNDALPTLKEVAAMLKLAPELKIGVEGHTDNSGSAEFNQTLSENRAKSVAAAIAESGIDMARLQPRGFGQDRAIADNRSEEGRAKNRRVELVKI